MHSTVSGVSDYIAGDELEAIAKVRDIVASLNWPAQHGTSSRQTRAPLLDPKELGGIVGTDLKQPYDVRQVIARIVDGSRFREFKREYGTTVVTGFASIHGYPVGIIANNGILFSPSALKATHFIELCSQRGIPLVFLVNVTGVFLFSLCTGWVG